jgi:hypothetical protein
LRKTYWLVGAVLAAGIAGCEIIAGLQDRQLETVDSSIDAAPDVSTCTSPRLTCGTTCVDPTSDPNHCGSCTKACAVPAAGGFDATTGNPNPGIPSFDAGDAAYVSVPAPTCEAGACGLDCKGEALCSGLCYDTDNLHDHCGDCTTACAAGAWCHGGHCCDAGTEFCDAGCNDVLYDNGNCGGCGISCGTGMKCVGSTCTSGVVFEETFTQNVPNPNACADWTTFRTSLTGVYTSVTMSGTLDPVGHTCTGAMANTLCQALHNGASTGSLLCDGNTWAVGPCGAGYFEINAKDGLICSCENPGSFYDLRPCSSTSWGGVNSITCSAPTQTVAIVCK